MQIYANIVVLCFLKFCCSRLCADASEGLSLIYAAIGDCVSWKGNLNSKSCGTLMSYVTDALKYMRN